MLNKTALSRIPRLNVFHAFLEAPTKACDIIRFCVTVYTIAQ